VYGTNGLQPYTKRMVPGQAGSAPGSQTLASRAGNTPHRARELERRREIAEEYDVEFDAVPKHEDGLDDFLKGLRLPRISCSRANART